MTQLADHPAETALTDQIVRQYRNLEPDARARLLARGVLGLINPESPSFRELARMVLEDNDD